MVENNRESISTISRRSLFRVSATGTLGLLAFRELRMMDEGLQTPDGTFYPLYEMHIKPMGAENLPGVPLDGFFREESYN